MQKILYLCWFLEVIFGLTGALLCNRNLLKSGLLSKFQNFLKEWLNKKINIELDQQIAEGIYSNLAIINHSVSEFIVDFVSLMPGSPKAKVKSRIILSPQHAKRLKVALEDNINRFEKSNGKIKNEISGLLFAKPLNCSIEAASLFGRSNNAAKAAIPIKE